MTFESIDFDWIKKEDGRVAVGADEVVIGLGGNPAHVSRYMRDIFPDYKFQWSGGTVGRAKWYVYEPGVYQLIFSSTLANIAPEKIEKFQRWVFNDVLPQLRKTGIIFDESRFNPAEIERLNQIVTERDTRIAELTEGKEFAEHRVKSLARKFNNTLPYCDPMIRLAGTIRDYEIRFTPKQIAEYVEECERRTTTFGMEVRTINGHVECPVLIVNETVQAMNARAN